MSNIFAVVEFPQENSCQCIPTSWLIKRNKFCLYPKVPAFKANDLVKKLVKPRFDGSWQELEVRVLVYTDTYEKARRKTAAAELTSTIETEDEFRTNLKRKRRTINYHRSSDEQSSVADIPPTPVRSFKRTRNLITSKRSDFAKVLFPPYPEPEVPLNSAGIGKQDVRPDVGKSIQQATSFAGGFTATPSAPHFILAPGSGLEGIPGSHGDRNVESSDLENQHLLIPEEHSSIQYASQTEQPFQSLDCRVPTAVVETRTIENSRIVEAEQVQVSDFQRTVLRILSILQEDIRKLYQLLSSSRNAGSATDNLTLPISLPITTEEEFLVLNNWLEEGQNRRELTDVLKLIGGETKEDVIRNLLQRIIGSTLNSKLNFTGKFNKKKLKGTNLFTLLKDTVRCTRVAAEATDSEIKSVVQRWLNGYKDRDGGRRHRQNEILQNRETARTGEI
ncbi:unnamed protein product [Orchesella dallaii]|uniref:DUF4806 domain-containing protein n=1 Tax=Orchesella dallaii TaxID=48710 RepID=A0ABP1QYX7_9HEXA